MALLMYRDVPITMMHNPKLATYLMGRERQGTKVPCKNFAQYSRFKFIIVTRASREIETRADRSSNVRRQPSQIHQQKTEYRRRMICS